MSLRIFGKYSTAGHGVFTISCPEVRGELQSYKYQYNGCRTVKNSLYSGNSESFRHINKDLILLTENFKKVWLPDTEYFEKPVRLPDIKTYTYSFKPWYNSRENLNTSKKASNPPSWTKKCLWATVLKHFHGEKKESLSFCITRLAIWCRTDKKSWSLLRLSGSSFAFMTGSCLLRFTTISWAKLFSTSTSSLIRVMFATARNCTLKQSPSRKYNLLRVMSSSVTGCSW